MSALGTWTITSNPFLAAARGSYINTKKMSNSYMAKLKVNDADPDIALIETSFEPFDTALDEIYAKYTAQKGAQNGAGTAFAQKLGEMTDKLTLWDSRACLIYPPDTASGPYKALFPNGHSRFQTGSQDSKITAVNVLIETLDKAIAADAANAPALTALKASVSSYYIDLIKAFDDKNNAQSITGIYSDACAKAATAVCEQMYFGLAQLIMKFYKTPEKLGNYFDETVIKTHKQTSFKRSPKPGLKYTIAERTLTADSEIRIKNTGPMLLRFYLAKVKDAAIGNVFLEVPAGTDSIFTSSQLGDAENNHFIMVTNPDELQTGSFVIKLL